MVHILGKQTNLGIDLKLRTKISPQRNNVKYNLNPFQEEMVIPFMIQPWQRSYNVAQPSQLCTGTNYREYE